MTCGEIRPELVTYHFGETPLEARASLEAHLLSCRECLQDYLSLKREIETADLASRPSPQARARLRRAVAADVLAPPATRAWSWWERPAAFLLAGATVLVALSFLHAVSTGPGSMPRSLDEAPPTVQEPAP